MDLTETPMTVQTTQSEDDKDQQYCKIVFFYNILHVKIMQSMETPMTVETTHSEDDKYTDTTKLQDSLL